MKHYTHTMKRNEICHWIFSYAFLFFFFLICQQWYYYIGVTSFHILVVEIKVQKIWEMLDILNYTSKKINLLFLHSELHKCSHHSTTCASSLWGQSINVSSICINQMVNHKNVKFFMYLFAISRNNAIVISSLCRSDSSRKCHLKCQ